MKLFSFITVVGLSLAIESQAFAEDYIRKNASTPEAQADVEALNTALAMMRKMGCTDPRSWYYQGAIHALPQEVKDNQLCPQYTSYEKDLLTAWDNCTHPQPQLEGSGSLHFLLWHRLYIAYFEKIVRKLSGKADFALPYWSYTDPDYRVMPALLRDKSSSLYEAARLPSLNNGIAIGQAPGEDTEKIDEALDVTDLLETRVFSTFSNTINAVPHGFMHDYIGGSYDGYSVYNPIYQKVTEGGLMSLVPSAGFDPVFWMHHSEIDRIWDSWNHSQYGRKAPEAVLLASPWPYTFFDGDGKEHKYTVAQAYDAAYNVDYSYDSLIPVSGTSVKKSLAEKALVQPKESTLKKYPVWTKSVSAVTDSSELTIKPAFLTKENNKRLLVESKPAAVVMQIDVSFDKEPKDFYLVSIKNKAGQLDKAGTMTFFGVSHHSGQGNMKMHTSFEFDVSDELADLNDYDIVIQSGKGEPLGISVDKISLFQYE